jgi:hypothetical protein
VVHSSRDADLFVRVAFLAWIVITLVLTFAMLSITTTGVGFTILVKYPMWLARGYFYIALGRSVWRRSAATSSDHLVQRSGRCNMPCGKGRQLRPAAPRVGSRPGPGQAVNCSVAGGVAASARLAL